MQTPYKRPRVGLCTSFLSQLKPSTAEAEVTLDVWVAPGSLQPPPSVAVPLIAVGPGTGVAPMNSLLQDRDVVCRVRISLFEFQLSSTLPARWRTTPTRLDSGGNRNRNRYVRRGSSDL